MKKVVALMGSPRKNKNTNQALDLVLDNMDKKEFEIEKIYLGELNIAYCTGCDYCGHKKNCVKRDDMDLLYKEFDSADIVILAAPLYFNSFNGLTKNIIDRCQKYWSLKYSHNEDYMRNQGRKGICIAVGGAPFTFDQYRGLEPVLDFFFKALNVDHIGNYFISNTDEISVKNRDIIKQELNDIGENFENLNKFHIQR